VLPSLLATGLTGRAAWALYGFLPLVWLPAGVGAYHALRATHPGAMLLALQFALLSAVSMMLGLLRWPSIHGDWPSCTSRLIRPSSACSVRCSMA
jgi:hypothetical protein